MKRILLVCMGNICRSPMAECLLRHRAEEAGLKDLEIDSAGIGGWHAGESPDHRMRSTAADHGITVEGAARQITVSDLETFDLILCSDAEILASVRGLGRGRAEIGLMMDHHSSQTGEDVPDPYYGGDEGFVQVFTLLDDAMRGLIRHLGGRPA